MQKPNHCTKRIWKWQHLTQKTEYSTLSFKRKQNSFIFVLTKESRLQKMGGLCIELKQKKQRFLVLSALWTSSRDNDEFASYWQQSNSESWESWFLEVKKVYWTCFNAPHAWYFSLILSNVLFSIPFTKKLLDISWSIITKVTTINCAVGAQC